MEPEEEPSVAAAREVCEEVGFLYVLFIYVITAFLLDPLSNSTNAPPHSDPKCRC